MGIRQRALTVLAAVGTIVTTGCLDRFYTVQGDLVITSRAADTSSLPAVVCTGHGGPPDSGMYAQPAASGGTTAPAYILCRIPSAPVRVSYRERVLGSSLPRKLHVYAFLEGAPDAQPLCEKSPSEALIPVLDPAFEGHLRCYDRHEPTRDMAFAITFDDSRRPTWTRGDRGWMEKRDIELR